MNGNWWTIILQFGGFGVLSLFYYLYIRHDQQRQDRAEADRKEEREAERKEREAMVKGFLETQNSQNQLIQNHLTHQETEFKEQQQEFRTMTTTLQMLQHGVERLCEKL